MLEHTLVLAGETVDQGAVWQVRIMTLAHVVTSLICTICIYVLYRAGHLRLR